MDPIKEYYNKYKLAFWGAAVLAVAGTAYGVYGWSSSYYPDTVVEEQDTWKSNIHVPSLKAAALKSLGEINAETLNAALKTEKVDYDNKKAQWKADKTQWKSDKKAFDKLSWWTRVKANYWGENPTKPVRPKWILGDDFGKLGLKIGEVGQADFAFTDKHVAEYRANKVATAEGKVDTEAATANYNDKYATYKADVEAANKANKETYMPLAAGVATKKPVVTDHNAQTGSNTEGEGYNTKIEGGETSVEGGDDTKTTKKENSSMGGWAIFLIICGIVLLVGALVYFIFFMRKGENDEERDAEAQNEL